MLTLLVLSLSLSCVMADPVKTSQTSCPTCVLAKSSSNTENVFPWLFNNNNARFVYTHTDDRGWPSRGRHSLCHGRPCQDQPDLLPNLCPGQVFLQHRECLPL